MNYVILIGIILAIKAWKKYDTWKATKNNTPGDLTTFFKTHKEKG